MKHYGPIIKYGMKVCGFVRPIQIFGPIAFTSSNTKRVYAEFEITRYWDDDNDPYSYKIVLMPKAPYNKYIPKEKMYSMDFVTSLCEKRSFVRAKDIFKTFVNYVKTNGKNINGYYTINVDNSDIMYNGYKLCKIKIDNTESFDNVKIFFKKGLFKKMVLLKHLKNSSEIMCKTFMNIN